MRPDYLYVPADRPGLAWVARCWACGRVGGWTRQDLGAPIYTHRCGALADERATRVTEAVRRGEVLVEVGDADWPAATAGDGG